MALDTANGKVSFNEMMTELEGGVDEAGKKLNEKLVEMKNSGDIKPADLLAIQRYTSIWTTMLSQVTTMGKAVADAAKGIVRNYN
jgi:hypothetical protein